MNIALKLAAVLLVILNVALLVPSPADYSQWIAISSVVLALVILAAAFAPKQVEAKPRPAVAEAVKPAPAAATTKNQAEAEVLTLLGVFQEKGRLVDFLMEDITPYNDAQVGEVARTVHQGCKAALKEHFAVEPISTEAEGAAVTVPAGYAADEYRLMGNLSGEPPFTGKLVHKGWRATSVKLPRVIKPEDGRLPAIAPAQIEL